MKQHFYEKKLAETNDFYSLRNMLIKILQESNEQDFTDKLLSKLKGQANNTHCYITLAGILIDYYNNFEQANEYAKKAIDCAKSSYDYENLAKFVSSYLKDPSFAETLNEEAKSLKNSYKI